MVESIHEILVEKPFYLRARVHDSKTANVLFEIARENQQRTCQMYQFTIRRNSEHPYSMPEQNLTFWRNSLELTHLDAGTYRICAIICSEHLKEHHLLSETLLMKNQSMPIRTCVNIHAYRSHFLFLTLYVLVFLILAFSQIVLTLRKRRLQATVKLGLLELEHNLQKWRSTQPSSESTDRVQAFNIIQRLVSLPVASVDYSRTSSIHTIGDETRPSCPILFHLNASNEHLASTQISEIP